MRTDEVCPVCKTYHNPACFIYVGEYLSVIDAQPGDSINEIFAKLDSFLGTFVPTTTTSSTTTTTTTQIPFLPNYFVSNTGDDNNDGLTEQTPWQTLAKVNATAFAPGDRIGFKRGDAWYGSLEPTSSGTLNNQITYGAYGVGNEPIITGLTEVTNWTDLGGNIWESTSAVSTLSYLNVVLINGVNTPMGRMPKINDVYIYQTHDTNVSITSNDLTGVPDWTGAEILIRKRGWAYEKGNVTNQIGDTVYYTDAGVYSITNDDCGFFFQAHPNCLTQQDDWYYDVNTKKLQMYSIGEPVNVKVPTLDNLTDLFNRNYITFQNIHFTGANQRGVYINTADYMNINHCTIDNIGWHGISSYDDHFSTIEYNTISECNHTAINHGGLTSSDVIITDNVISNIYMIPGIGQNVYPLGAICVTSNNPLIQYNDVDYSGYNGIIASSTSILTGLIKNNFVNNSLQTLADGGGIYTGNAHTDLVIEYNIVLNSLGATLGSPDGYNNAKGIYLDVGASNVTVTGNTISTCYIGMCMSASNTFNIFDSNVVFNNYREMDITNIASAIEGSVHDNVIINNQFVTKNSTQTVAKFQSSFAGDMENFFSNIDYNIYARPIADTSTIWFYQPSIVGPNSQQPLSVWKTFIGQEAASITSPYTISAESELYMVYNKSKVANNIAIPFPSKDLLGNIYTDFVTLQPYRSIILFQII